MNFQDLMEGTTPKLPGAVRGIQVMTPQQFVVKSAEGEEPEPETKDTDVTENNDLDAWERDFRINAPKIFKKTQQLIQPEQPKPEQPKYTYLQLKSKLQGIDVAIEKLKILEKLKDSLEKAGLLTVGLAADADVSQYMANAEKDDYKSLIAKIDQGIEKLSNRIAIHKAAWRKKKAFEATKLPAQTRELKGQELEDYLERIRKQEKQKTDKYKLPYIHRSSVIGYYNEEGKKYNTDAIKDALRERPKKLLKQNEKMKHSNGESEQFFNIGFAALVGIALDEETNELIIVNTCPGAGSCKVDCFAMKGGKIQFQGPWLSDARILTYLLNDPDGFFAQLDSEIKKEEKKADKGGYSLSIRWHDAGDFFSPEYVDMAYKLARENPDVSFYAYTKVSDVAMGDKPGNFMINWSEGASSREEKKVKAADPGLEKTKNSRIVPSDLFYDLLVKDEKKNLVKGPEGQWQVIPSKIPELKQRLSQAYRLSPSSILTYDEWESKVKGKDSTPLKYNVIITPGEPDLTAKDPGVLSTLLLKH